MKKIFLLIIFMLLFSVVGCNNKAEAFKVEKSEDIVAVKVTVGDQEIVYNDKSFIDEVINISKDATPTRKESVNDTPTQKDFILVYLLYDDNTGMRFFVYLSDEKAYIEIPYTGIWEVNSTLYYGLIDGNFNN